MLKKDDTNIQMCYYQVGAFYLLASSSDRCSLFKAGIGTYLKYEAESSEIIELLLTDAIVIALQLQV
jgi:hypothetical protein